MSTLVILGASITALAVARDAHRHGLQAVVVDSEDGPALHSRRAMPVSLGATTVGATVDRILSLGGTQAAVIATSDQWIRFVIEHRSLLSSAYKTILHSDNAALELCLDKKKPFRTGVLRPGFRVRRHGLRTVDLVLHP